MALLQVRPEAPHSHFKSRPASARGFSLGATAAPRSYCEPTCLSAGSITWIDQGQSSAAHDLGTIDAENARH